MHLNLDQFNLLIGQKATSHEREEWVDHLLACDRCSVRFRMFNELSLRSRGTTVTRKPLRYALAAAAVMFMCLYPYLANLPEKHAGSGLETALDTETRNEPLQLALLEQVKRVNYQTAIVQWNRGADLRDILLLQDRMKP